MNKAKRIQAALLTAVMMANLFIAIPLTASAAIAMPDDSGYTDGNMQDWDFPEELSDADTPYEAADISKGIYIADITRADVTIKTSRYTDRTHRNWASVSQISQFIDNNRNIAFAYEDANNVYIEKLDKSMKRTATLTIAKRYPLLGAVTCDPSGNYYIIWGQDDTEGKGSVETIAVSKYSNSGRHVKTTAIVSSNDSGLGRTNTKQPFNAGNCAVAVHNGVLVCSYARTMYNGHQSNAIIAVNINDMSLRTDINAYTSHSFDQRVIYHQGLNTFIFADHGDAYPRGFNITLGNLTGNNTFLPFKFYQEPHYWDNMYLLNQTGAQLGGIGELSTGIVLAASSAKAFAPSFMTDNRQLFVQIFNPRTSSFTTSGTRRDPNGVVIDNGVKWLTDYKDSTVQNPQMAVTDNDRVVVMWEEFRDNQFINSYFMVLSSKGDILVKATPIFYRLNAFEEPYFSGGYVYWVTANGETATVNKMSLNPKLVLPPSAPKNLTATPDYNEITLSWTVPSDDGGSSITNYQVSIDKGITWIDASSDKEHIFTNLTEDTSYDFKVRAVNIAGYGIEVSVSEKTLKTPAEGWNLIDKKWYYYRNGIMQTGWLEDNGVWYYLDPVSGVMTDKKWIRDGAWYYFRPGGEMATGWVNDGGTWYYMALSGAMAEGWIYDGNAWYYLTPGSGAMATGWVYDGGLWYFLQPGGAMLDNDWLLWNGAWYFLKPGGAMAADEWVTWNGARYYMGADGVWMASAAAGGVKAQATDMPYGGTSFIEATGTGGPDAPDASDAHDASDAPTPDN